MWDPGLSKGRQNSLSCIEIPYSQERNVSTFEREQGGRSIWGDIGEKKREKCYIAISTKIKELTKCKANNKDFALYLFQWTII